MSDRARSTGGGRLCSRATLAPVLAFFLAFGLLLGSQHVMPASAQPWDDPPASTTTTTTPTTTTTAPPPTEPPPPPPPPPTEPPTTVPATTAPPTTQQEVASPDLVEVRGPLTTTANLLVSGDGTLGAQETTTTTTEPPRREDNRAAEEDRILWLIVAGLAALAVLAALLTWRYWLLTRPGLDLEEDEDDGEPVDHRPAPPAGFPEAGVPEHTAYPRSPDSVFVPPPGAAPGPPAPPPTWPGEMPPHRPAAPPQRPPQAPPPQAPRPGEPPRHRMTEQQAFGNGPGFPPPPPPGAAGPPSTARRAGGRDEGRAPDAAAPGQRRGRQSRAPGGGKGRARDAAPKGDRRSRRGARSGEARDAGGRRGVRGRGDPFWDWAGDGQGGDPLPPGDSTWDARPNASGAGGWPPQAPRAPRRRR